MGLNAGQHEVVALPGGNRHAIEDFHTLVASRPTFSSVQTTAVIYLPSAHPHSLLALTPHRLHKRRCHRQNIRTQKSKHTLEGCQ